MPVSISAVSFLLEFSNPVYDFHFSKNSFKKAFPSLITRKIKETGREGPAPKEGRFL